ncbi:MAG: glutamate-cysteine ligase family protein [Planctomycetota bacterium]|jgi:CBS domain-containing protein/gamma-glutamyl:cysteine ligase YbdK (ATP-grasp superfamily)
MGEHDVSNELDQERLRVFMKAVLTDVRALETMLAEGWVESGVRRIGAEQEMFLVDEVGRPALTALEVLGHVSDDRFTTELALFNLEANLSPHVFGNSCLRKMEAELCEALALAREAAEKTKSKILLAGILPTLRQSDLGLENMTPIPRYKALNDALKAHRGNSFQFRIKGVDELDIQHDNVMLESCNTSFQCHFQVGPDEFASLYNVAQAVTAPVLAVAVNSPLLLGRRLWQETRVALFQQSIDSRSETHQARGRRPRVSFGDSWVDNSVLEIFREDIARFRVVLSCEVDDDPNDMLFRGETPPLTALCMHNGTVYRWNRACYGVYDGKAHLRIENRALPSGPTPLDTVANAAFFFGLMAGISRETDDITKMMGFDDTKANFVAAARLGLKAQLMWWNKTEYAAPDLIRNELLPLARRGLEADNIDSADIDRYLGVIEARVESGRTGAQWTLDSLQRMADTGTRDQRMQALTRAMIRNAETGEPVHTWEPATMADSADWHHSYQKVGQFMVTDVFTVHPEDVVDLAASLMDWRHIRHVPVEDHDGKLIGLVSHRSLLRMVGRGLSDRQGHHVAVKDIMMVDPVTATPDMSTLQAIELMREHRVGCLPVIERDKLVGIVTERDLIQVASILFEQQLRESAPE